jgi:class 3 adenylate cyclase
VSAVERLLKGDRPAPLEMIVGSSRYAEELVQSSVRWIVMIVGCGAIGMFLAGGKLGLNRIAIGIVIAIAFALMGVILVVGTRGARLFFPVLALAAGALTSFVVWLAGPRFAVTVGLIPAYTAAASLFFSNRTRNIATGFSLGGYALVLAFADGYPRPVARFLVVTGATVSTTYVIGRFVSRLEALALSERRLHEEVDTAKRQLEARVGEQVDEIERLGRLRRFLSPQVADAVVSSGTEDILATHRRQIAVIFVDLRGFTSFSAVAEPEDVIEVLAAFYDAVGQSVKQLGATVGGFAGDGVMAYFNDPFPCDDPAGRAVAMAQSLREPMSALRDRWRDRGFEIGFGAGIAYGYATLGTIGFEDRSDYTPIGSVVNLASRLCDEAGDGELLLDGRAFSAVRNDVRADRTEMTLKGFAQPVSAYRVCLS